MRNGLVCPTEEQINAIRSEWQECCGCETRETGAQMSNRLGCEGALQQLRLRIEAIAREAENALTSVCDWIQGLITMLGNSTPYKVMMNWIYVAMHCCRSVAESPLLSVLTTTLLGGFYAVVRSRGEEIKHFVPQNSETGNDERGASQRAHAAGAKARRAGGPTRALRQGGRDAKMARYGMHAAEDDTMMRKMTAAIGHVRAEAGTKDIMTKCLFLGGNKVLVNLHIMLRLMQVPESERKLIFESKTERIEVEGDDLEEMFDMAACLEDNDAVIVEVKTKTVWPDITRYFMQEIELDRWWQQQRRRPRETVEIRLQRPTAVNICRILRMWDRTTVCGTKYARVVVYNEATREGDCGLPIVTGGEVNRRILGIHFAGDNENEGLFTCLSREQVLQACKESTYDWEPSEKAEERAVLQMNDRTSIYHELRDEGYIQTEYIQPADRVRICDQSKIVPSCLYPYLPIKTAPARMRACDYETKVSPLLVGIRKQFQEEILIPEDSLDIAFSHVIRYYHNTFRHRTEGVDTANRYRRAYSLEEALNGDPERYMSPLELTTSPGWPFCNKSKYPGTGPGKNGFVYKTAHGDIALTPDTKTRYLTILRRIVAGQGKAIIAEGWFDFMDTLKDEKLPIDKTARVFSAGSLYQTLLGRQLYMGVLGYLTALNHEDWHKAPEVALGCDPHDAAQWTRIARTLLEKGTEDGEGDSLGDMHDEPIHVFAGDFSNYDKSLPWQVMDRAFEIMDFLCGELAVSTLEGFTQEEETKLRLFYQETITRAHHRADNCRYRVEWGNPSGNAVTTVINSISNQLLMRIAANEICKVTPTTQRNRRRRGFDDEGYDEVCGDVWPMPDMIPESSFALVVYGDDVIVASSTPDFTLKATAEAFASLGIKFTDPTKAGEVTRDWLEWDEITFLKRKFRPVPLPPRLNIQGTPMHRERRHCIFRAPLDPASICDTMGWMKKGEEGLDAFRSALKSAQLELAHYSTGEQTRILAFLQDVMEEVGEREMWASEWQSETTYWAQAQVHKNDEAAVHFPVRMHENLYQLVGTSTSIPIKTGVNESELHRLDILRRNRGVEVTLPAWYHGTLPSWFVDDVEINFHQGRLPRNTTEADLDHVPLSQLDAESYDYEYRVVGIDEMPLADDEW